MAASLTDRELRALKPRDRSYTVTEKTGRRQQGRLVVKVLPSGTKEFYFQYWTQGRRRQLKLGNYSQRSDGLSLADARAKQEALAGLYGEGIDVKAHLAAEERRRLDEQREQQRLQALEEAQGSVQQLLASYITQMKESGKRSHEDVRKSLDRYVLNPFPEFGQKKAKDAAPADIQAVLSRMIRNGITTHSNRVRAHLHAAFQHGLKQDHNPRSYLPRPVQFGLTHNPVSAIPRQQDFERVGERTLDEHETALLWQKLPEHAPRLAGILLCLCYATGGQRHGELLRCRWEYYDLKNNVLEMPGIVTKNGRSHVVPLSALAKRLVQEAKKLSGDCEYPFPGGVGSGFREDRPMRVDSLDRAVARFCEAAAFPRFAPRDLRRSVKTMMGKAGIEKSIRDRLQNHALTDVSTRHYDRYDYLPEKRRAIAQWTRYLQRFVGSAGPKSKQHA